MTELEKIKNRLISNGTHWCYWQESWLAKWTPAGIHRFFPIDWLGRWEPSWIPIGKQFPIDGVPDKE